MVGGWNGSAVPKKWTDGVFPPASYSSFRRVLPGLPGLLLADFEDTFANR